MFPFIPLLAFKTPINTDLQKKTTFKKLPISCPFLTKFDQKPKKQPVFIQKTAHF
ncbi:hypothetical protein EZS27_012761 [termite gut metagenome]|uniref:Uncharacterized protein n=1 Tax=termite gut metagenome TaxID=433724 RepID=A0A5J4S1K0_9ZZZZ